MSTNVIEVDSKRLCFLCLSECPSALPANANQSPSIAGFGKLLNYVKADVTQSHNKACGVLQNAKISTYVPVSANDSVKVGVSLCFGCALITEKFGELFGRYGAILLEFARRVEQSLDVNELYQRWELLKDQLDTCVKSVHQLMKNGNESLTRVKDYKTRMEPQNVNEVFNFNFADNLRSEIIEKCTTIENNCSVTPSSSVEKENSAAHPPPPIPSNSGANLKFPSYTASVSLSSPATSCTSAGNDTASTIRCQDNGTPASAVSIGARGLQSSPVSGSSSIVDVNSPMTHIRENQFEENERDLSSPESPGPPVLSPQVSVVDNSYYEPVSDDDTPIVVDVEDSLDSEDAPVMVDLAFPPSTHSRTRRRNWKSKMILCVFCVLPFPSQGQLDQHMLYDSCRHSRKKHAKCSTCQGTITSVPQRTGRKNCHGKFTNKCSFCGHKVHFRCRLKTHILKTHFMRMVMREIPKTEVELSPVVDQIMEDLCIPTEKAGKECALCFETQSCFAALKVHLGKNHFNEMVELITIDFERAQELV